MITCRIPPMKFVNDAIVQMTLTVDYTVRHDVCLKLPELPFKPDEVNRLRLQLRKEFGCTNNE